MINHLNISERINTKDIYDWFKPDIIIKVNSFNEKSVTKFADKFALAHESGQDIIIVVIDSYGGDIYSVLAMIDIIKAAKKPVATIAVGKAMSCGAILLTCGDEGLRFASPTSTIMIHDVSIDTWGKMEEIKADAKECERLNKLIFKLMEKNCGLKKGQLLNILRTKHNSADWYLTPKQAKKLNIINSVKIPELVTKIIVKSELVY